MGVFTDITGNKFGHLVAQWPVGRDKISGNIVWLFLCDCGGLKTYTQHDVKRLNTPSCGCFRTQSLRESHLTHGQSKSPEYLLWARAKNRAKEEGLPFGLEYTDIVIPDTCPVFPWLRLERASQKRLDNSPSIDKIIPALGYVKSNIIIISWKANRLKNNATMMELEYLFYFYEKLIKEM